MEFNEHMQIMQILEIQILWLPYRRGYYILISFWLSLHGIGFASFLFILFSLPQNGQENIFTQHTYQRLHNFLSKSRTYLYHMKCGSTKLLLCIKVLSPWEVAPRGFHPLSLMWVNPTLYCTEFCISRENYKHRALI